MVICCIGDSLTEGDYGIKGVRGVPNVHAENYPYFLQRMTGAEVRNFGRCGWRASHIYNWYREGGFSVAGADKIVICLGTNGGHSMTEETEDNQAYLLLIDRLRAEAPGAEIYVCTPPHVTEDPSYINCGYAPQVRAARSFVKRLAAEKEVRLIDLGTDPHFTAETEAEMQPNDGLHFTEKGYQTLAGVIAEAIL